MAQVKIVRVVVASPSDVAAEREAVVRAAEEVNRNVAENRGMHLRVYRWETDARPGLHAKGPQGIIDPILRIEDCDLLIGIFWKRFGTPTLDGRTGTEHEFNIAYEAWKEKRWPEIMMYFRRQPEGSEDQQSRLVIEFQRRFPKEGFSWSYDGAGEFENLVRNHLARFVLGLEPLSVLNALHSLPPPPDDFIGRQTELDELREAIEHGGAHISGLQGQGGIGKTVLALKLAEALSETYPDAQIYLDLRGAGDKPMPPAEALAHVIRAFHPDAKLPEGEAELAGTYQSVLRDKRALLLMDNARDAAQVRPLLPPKPCGLLVTSRWHFALPGLRAKDLSALPPEDAKALLLAIEPRIDGQAADIARLCGYLPQALRLAAGALAEHRNLDPADYARRLSDERQRLKQLGSGEDSVEASINLSYGLLSPEMQQRWRMLGVFPDTFDAPAAAALWNGVILSPFALPLRTVLSEAKELRVNSAKDPGVAAPEDVLGELLKYSMLEWNETSKRYRLHDLMRDFARVRLEESGEQEEAARRHAAYYVEVLAQPDDLYKKRGDSIKPGLSLFDLEWGNIQAGQAWAVAHAGQNDEVAKLCSRYPYDGWHCLSLRQSPRQRVPWLEVALGAARRLRDLRAEGWHAAGLGLAFEDLGESRKAISYHEKHLAVARDTGDRRGEGAALGNLGNAHESLGEYQRAVEFYEQALTIARQIEDRRGEGYALGNLGIAYKNLGEYRRAIEYHEQDLVVARETGDRRGEGTALGGLGNAYDSLGEYRRAIEHHEQHLTIAREIGDRQGEGTALGNLGNAYYSLGEYRRAIEYAEAALVIFDQIESPHVEMVRKQLEEWKASGWSGHRAIE
jgi:tetratricopeptide (TPR) repeat protein